MRKAKSGRIQPARTSTRLSARAEAPQFVWRGEERPDRSWADIASFHVGRTPSRRVIEAVPDESQPGAALCIHDHEWVVYSTSLQEHWLMLQCVECGAMGSIDDPSSEEWSSAYHAPSRPYRWDDVTRTERGHAAPRVIRAADGPRCDCPSRLSFPGPGAYERVPGGIWVHPGGLSDTERAELNELAEFVARTDLCSRFLPLFVRSCEADTGLHHSVAMHTILDRIERWDSEGLHCSPPVVARIIREFAAR